MNKRKSMSKTLRFEVFKRDSFSCQYCGATPSKKTMLEVDHIKPVAKGGDNDILNLITSCFDCNRGKSARELSDDSVVVKQKKQLDNLQEKREQFKMMYEWRKGLDGLTSEAAHMITEYIESKVEPFVLSKSAKKNLEKTINKYDFDDILNAINISESTYLRYEVDDTLEPDSVKNFFSKITGILVNSSRSPLELKISRIKGIGRKQFDNWEPQKGAIVLSKMLKKMRSYPGSSDESILAVLENTIEPMTQDAKSWRQWKWMMEEFLEALEDQQTNNATFSALHEKIGNQEYDLSLQNEVTVNNCIQMTQWVFPALSAVGSKITFEKKLTYWRLCSGVLNYLSSLNEYYDERLLSERDGFPSLVDEYIPTGLIKPSGLVQPRMWVILFKLSINCLAILSLKLRILLVVIRKSLRLKNSNLWLTIFIHKSNGRSKINTFQNLIVFLYLKSGLRFFKMMKSMVMMEKAFSSM